MSSPASAAPPAGLAVPVPDKTAAAVRLILSALLLTVFLIVVRDGLPTSIEVLFGVVLIGLLGGFRARHPTKLKFSRSLLVLLLAAAGIAAVAAIVANDRSELVTVVAALTGVMAIGDAVLELRKAPWAVPLGWVVAIVGASAGLFGAFAGRSAWLLISFVLAPVAITLVTATFAGNPRSNLLARIVAWPRTKRRLLVSVLIVCGGLLLWWAMSGAWLYALGLGLLTFIMVNFIVANTNADIIALAAVVSFAWALQPRVTSDPSEHLPTSGPALVAIGDSYQSGEGSPVFINGTNQANLADRLDNKCRRASTAYPVLLAEGIGGAERQRLTFVSCSGAVAADILVSSQYEGEGAPDSAVIRGGRLVRRGPSQLAMAARTGDVATVLVSIGGNDIGFGDLVEACLGPTDCSTDDSAKIIASLLIHYQKDLERSDLFGKIGTAFVNARLVLVPYPLPVADTRCMWSPMKTTEHATIIGIVKNLNRINFAAASAAGFQLADTQSAFVYSVPARGKVSTKIVDRRICGNGNIGSAVNLFSLNPESNPLHQVAYPTNWFHNSVHPTPLGHRLIANRLVASIVDCAKPPTDATYSSASACEEPDLGTVGDCITRANCEQALRDVDNTEFRNFLLKLLAGLFLVTAAAILTHQPIRRLVEPLGKALGDLLRRSLPV